MNVKRRDMHSAHACVEDALASLATAAAYCLAASNREMAHRLNNVQADLRRELDASAAKLLPKGG